MSKNDKTTLYMKDELIERSEKLQGSNSVLGITLLTQPAYISGSRSMMWTGHFKQHRTLNNPDIPKYCSGYENVVGKYSSSNVRSDGKKKVAYKVQRFSEFPDFLYYLFTYDEENDMYDVIEKKNIDNLTETYGFRYNTDNIDSKQIGDTIYDDESLFASSSYDKNGNYRYGKNLCTAIMLEPFTIEDAIIRSKRVTKLMECTDVDTVTVPLNDNDIFINLYGNTEEYKCFPDIGCEVKNGLLAATKRIHNDQLLYDLKKGNTRKVNFSTDKPYYFEDGTIEDIFIYSNKKIDELPNTRFYTQIKRYYKMQNEFYQQMYDVCNEIINSGSKYHEDITNNFSIAKRYLDPEAQWVSDNNIAFNNMIIKFTVSTVPDDTEGQKYTGRAGNKGVVSKEWPEEMMPYTEDGRRIDIIVNALGPINRLISFPLFEIFVNCISDILVQKLKKEDSIELKEQWVFDILYTINDEPDKTDKIKQRYDTLDKDGKEEFFESIIENGLYYKFNPLWESPIKPLFYRLMDLMKKYDWIEPQQCYVNRFGRKIPIMRKLVIGDMYYIKLRQSSKKNYTARSTGSISKLGFPEKSNKSSNHEDTNPKTPVRIGLQDALGLLVGVKPEELNQLHKYYRMSITGRNELGQRLLTSTHELETIGTDNDVENTAVMILNQCTKTLGFRTVFKGDQGIVVRQGDGPIKEWHYEDKCYIGSAKNFEHYLDEQRALKSIKEGKIKVLTNDKYDEMLKEEIEMMRHRREGTTIEINLKD